MSVIAQWAVVFGLLATALALLGRYVVGPLKRLFQKIESVADTYNGEPARDGLPARPGIVDRLIYIENELKTNGGTSVKDAANKMQSVALAVERIESKVDRAADLAAEAKEAVAEVKAHSEVATQDAHDEREAISTRLTNWVEEGQVREAAYLASLAELGIDIKPQPRTET